MSVPAAYLGIIAIWSTTPLAVHWSSESSYLYGLTMRMVLAAFATVLIAIVLRARLVWDKRAWAVYAVSGCSIYTAMLTIYWSAQHIPTGWISVIFGLSPIFTGVLASVLLNERALSPPKVVGMLFGVGGLWLVFNSGASLGDAAALGVAGVFLSTAIHATSAVTIKRLNQELSGLAITIGGLLVAAPGFVLTALISGIDWNPELSLRAQSAILYLGLVGSALGFTLYYYLLRHVSAVRVSLITLITPVCGLLLGAWLNEEPIMMSVWTGAGLIGIGLLCFEFEASRFWLQRLMGMKRHSIS